jgi:hypothetical protein
MRACPEMRFICPAVVIAQQVVSRIDAALRLGPRRALLRPYFPDFFRAQSDFGHSGPLCVHVDFKAGALESDFLQKPACRANRSDRGRVFTPRSD